MCSIWEPGAQPPRTKLESFLLRSCPVVGTGSEQGLLCDLPGVRIGANLLGFLSYLHNTRIIPVVLYINYTYIIIYIWLYIYVPYTITYILHINYMHPSIFAYAHWQSSMKTSWKHLCCFLLFLLRPGIGEVKVHATQPWSSVVKSKPLGEVQHVPCPLSPDSIGQGVVTTFWLACDIYILIIWVIWLKVKSPKEMIKNLDGQVILPL